MKLANVISSFIIERLINIILVIYMWTFYCEKEIDVACIYIL